MVDIQGSGTNTKVFGKVHTYLVHCIVIAFGSLFRNKRFILDEMTQQNASKFAIFLEYENPCSFFCYFIFSPNECPGLCRHNNVKSNFGFSYTYIKI